METVQIRYTEQQLQTFLQQLFTSAGVEEHSASLVSRHLVTAHMRGVTSHGVIRTGIYIKRLRKGVVEKKDGFTIERETPVSATVNGGNGLGIPIASESIKLAVQKAKQSGVGMVAVTNSNHCGMLADYTNYAADQGCISLAFTNSPSAVAPWGGLEKYFGTNPFSYAVPRRDAPNIVFDMATSAVAKGKIIAAKNNGESIPLGWAITKDGEPTTDPAEALDGLLLPVGGPKGYGIAFLVEMLSTALSGAATGPHMGDLYHDFEKKQNNGHFFLAFRPDLFEDIDVFHDRIDQLAAEVQSVAVQEGIERVLLPGELEHAKLQKHQAEGVELSPVLAAELRELALELGVDPLD